MAASCKTDRIWIALLAGVLVPALGVRAARALDVIGYSATVNNRFTSGFPTAPVTNTSGSFVGAGYSWLGVGWSASDPTKGFGFLTPQHFLATVHYGGATTIDLLDGAGSVYSVTQSALTNAGYGFTNGGTQTPDIAVGKVTAPIATTRALPRYGVLDRNSTSTTNSTYNGQSLLVYGRGPDGTQSPRIGTASVNATTTTGSNIYIQSNASSVVLQVGDSGSPDFIPWTNPDGQAELTIIGNNAATDFTTVNIYNMLGNSGVMGAINALTTPDGYALRVVGTPSNTWEGNLSTSITANNAWQTAPAPADDYVLFSGTAAGNGRAVAVNSGANLRGLYFKSTGSGTLGFTFSGAGTLTVGRGGITNYDTSRQTISSTIALGSHQYWNGGAGGVTAAAINTGTGFLLEIAGSGTSRITGGVSGAGGLALSGGRLELTGSSSYTGATWGHAGTLVVDGTIGSSSGVSLAAEGILAGSGRVPAIAGFGAVSPGTGVGILTAPSVSGAAGLDFDFTFTGTGSPLWSSGTASVNDVLRLTSASTPFAAALTSTNSIDVFLNVASLTPADVYRGGFFTDLDTSFLASVQSASWNYYLATPGGGTVHDGVAYAAYTGPYSFSLSTVAETANFTSGSEAGYVVQMIVVPEPGVAGAAGLALLAVRLVRRRRS